MWPCRLRWPGREALRSSLSACQAWADLPPSAWTGRLCRNRFDLGSQFKLDGAEVAEMRVPPSGVVEALDVVADGGSADGAGGEVLEVDMLGLEGGEEALCDGVVVAVAGAAHAGGDSAVYEGLPILVAGVGATPVGVVHQAGRGVA